MSVSRDQYLKVLTAAARYVVRPTVAQLLRACPHMTKRQIEALLSKQDTCVALPPVRVKGAAPHRRT
jgi:hypothetical protein